MEKAHANNACSYGDVVHVQELLSSPWKTIRHQGVDTVLHIMEARRPMVTGPRQPT